jgi:hypothetical protein
MRNGTRLALMTDYYLQSDRAGAGKIFREVPHFRVGEANTRGLVGEFWPKDG